MKILKQSTSKVVIFGPVVASDGVTPNTGLVSALDHATTGIFLAKSGNTPAIRHATVAASTYTSYGQYQVTLDTTDTATLGLLTLMWASTSVGPPVWDTYSVVPAPVYDCLINNTDYIGVNVIKINTISTSSVLGVNSYIGTNHPINFTGTGTTAYIKGDVIDVAGTAQTAGDLFAALTIASNRSGAITGSGANTVLGMFQAVTRTDASLPTDLGGTFTSANASLEAFFDNALTAVTIADAVTNQIVFTKNVAFTNFPFSMYNTDGTLATTTLAASVVTRIQQDAGAVAATSGSCTAKVDGSSNKTGAFRIDLTQAEMNGNVITFLATATGCKPTVVNIITQE